MCLGLQYGTADFTDEYCKLVLSDWLLESFVFDLFPSPPCLCPLILVLI